MPMGCVDVNDSLFEPEVKTRIGFELFAGFFEIFVARTKKSMCLVSQAISYFSVDCVLEDLMFGEYIGHIPYSMTLDDSLATQNLLILSYQSMYTHFENLN